MEGFVESIFLRCRVQVEAVSSRNTRDLPFWEKKSLVLPSPEGRKTVFSVHDGKKMDSIETLHF